ncbi:MAG TPA: hypothetical protein VIJ38_17795 [Acidobacteriaceae bacterium]
MKRAHRIGAWLGGSLLALLLTCALVVFAFFHIFYPHVRPANYPPTHNLATAQRQDLDYFKQYFTLNRSYTPSARAQAERLFRDTYAKVGALSPAAFSLSILRMVALADNGHSQVYKGSLSSTNNRIPCRLYHFADGYYVIRTRPACAALLGAKLIAVDAQPVDELVDRMFEYSGGPRNHYDQYVSVFFLESPALLHAAGLVAQADQLTLQVQLRDGSLQKVAMHADPPNPDAPDVYSDAYLSPQHIDGEAADWSPLLARDAALPLFLRDYANPFQATYWPGKSMYYVLFRSNENEPGHPIGPFVNQVEHRITAVRPRYIVLDLRLDQGGDFVTTAALMKRITTLTGSIQHVYVLVSAWTFSAGNIGLALVKDHGGRKVTVIGEPAGDRVRIWAEGSYITLPHSKLDIGFATGYEDYSKPCWRRQHCFWTTLFFPTHVASFDPDIRVPYTFDDYVHLRDPLLAKAMSLASNATSQH